MSNEVEFEYTGKEEREDVPKDVTIVRFHPSVTEVDDYMFMECEQLKKVVFNEGLKKIGRNAFYGCRQLEQINLPSTLFEVDASAFRECAILRDVVFNEGPQNIGIEPMAFARCTSLERIALPHTVRVISGNTFYGCQRLREVELHEGVQMIASNAFPHCSFFESFTFPTLSTRLESIIRAGQTEVEDKIDDIRGNLVERRGSEMFISDVRNTGTNWIIIRSILSRIDRLITYYEVKEVTTLLELAMWREKMDQAEVKDINRDEYRIDIPGPVKDTILQYLNFRV